MRSLVRRPAALCLSALVTLLYASCGPGEFPDPSELNSPQLQSGRSHLGSATISTDAASYAANATVVATFSGFPADDSQYVVLAVRGTPLNSQLSFQYARGVDSGTIQFTGVTEGNYLVRAFSDASGKPVLLAESAPFGVGLGSVTVSTSQAAYAAGESVEVSFSGSSAPLNWVAISPAGAPVGQTIKWSYTGADASGTRTFSGLGEGRYVARFYANNLADLLAESAAFTVGNVAAGVQIRAEKASYNLGEVVNVSANDLPGNDLDWVSVEPARSPDLSFVQWVYTRGDVGFVTSFFVLPEGQYVARAYLNNSATKIAESQPFTVTANATSPRISSASPQYGAGEKVVANFSNLSSNAQAWISIAPEGSSRTVFTKWVYTGGTVSGQVSFEGVGDGRYVLRAYFNNGGYLIAQSEPFSISGNSGAASVSTDKASYSAQESVSVSFEGLPGTSSDWVGIYLPGASNYEFVTYRYVGSQSAGQIEIAGLPPGNYVARIFPNNTWQSLAESQPFTVSP